jgi:hypothetical protein
MKSLRLPRRRERRARKRRLGYCDYIAFVCIKHLSECDVERLAVLIGEMEQYHAATPTAGTR